MKRIRKLLFWPPFIVIIGCFFILASFMFVKAQLFNSSEICLTKNIRVSFIDKSGNVVYDTHRDSLPNHSERTEIKLAITNGLSKTVVRDSESLGIPMLYHARKTNRGVVRIAVPYNDIETAKTGIKVGLIASALIGATIVAILFFVTQRVRREFNVIIAERDAQEKLVCELRRLEEFRKEFVSNAAHEIRTPLTGLLGAVDLLTDEPNLGAEDKKAMLSILREQSKRLDCLAQDILSLANLEKAPTEAARIQEKCDISEIMQRVFTLSKPLATSKGIELVLLKNESVKIKCDPALIEEALQNLIGNAIRYSQSKTIELALTNKRTAVILSVKDYGIGIAPEHQSRIFERFYRIDKARSRELGGTGLGLAIVKHIARLHGGKISLTSNINEGCTFSIVLPKRRHMHS